ncbi:MAG: polyphosphate polymerase domain-containing protein [bacterium]|nr:polyphosphate polymerase domain-containing protein [bacterium]
MELTRAEYKFLITYDDYIKLKFQLSHIMTLDAHADTSSSDYHLTSIYYDDLMDTHLFEKSDGLEYHQKYRVRFYSTGDTRLEYKTKIGNMTSKRSLWLSNELTKAILERDYEILYRHLDQELIENIVVRMKLDDLKPTLIIEYDREAFVYPQGDVRITFDKALTARRFDQDIAYERKLYEPKYMILEVKYTGLLPDFIRSIVFFKNFQPVSFSKYYTGWLTTIY